MINNTKCLNAELTTSHTPGPHSLYVAQPIQDKVMCFVFVHPDNLRLAMSVPRTQVQDCLDTPEWIYP